MQIKSAKTKQYHQIRQGKKHLNKSFMLETIKVKQFDVGEEQGKMGQSGLCTLFLTEGLADPTKYQGWADSKQQVGDTETPQRKALSRENDKNSPTNAVNKTQGPGDLNVR